MSLVKAHICGLAHEIHERDLTLILWGTKTASRGKTSILGKDALALNRCKVAAPVPKHL